MEPRIAASLPTNERKAQATAPAAATTRVSFSGLARAQDAVSQLVLGVEQLGLFEQVQLLESRRTKFFDQDALAFRIECEISDVARSGGGAP
jgi:hypothetical protein